MAGDQLNQRGGSFLPADDDFFAGRQKPTAQPKRQPAPPPPVEEEPEDGFVNGNGFNDSGVNDNGAEDPSSRLGRVTPPAGDTELSSGMNGVKEMAGGLPEALRKEAALLGIELSDEDVAAYVFKGSVAKEIPVIKNVLSARIRTLTSAEISDINGRMSVIIKENPEMMQREYQNRNAMCMFAYAVEGLGAPGKVKLLPKDFTARHKQLESLAPQVIAKLTHRYNLLEFLIQDKISDEAFVKNS
jgi:hypothetical protein